LRQPLSVAIASTPRQHRRWEDTVPLFNRLRPRNQKLPAKFRQYASHSRHRAIYREFRRDARQRISPDELQGNAGAAPQAIIEERNLSGQHCAPVNVPRSSRSWRKGPIFASWVVAHGETEYVWIENSAPWESECISFKALAFALGLCAFSTSLLGNRVPNGSQNQRQRKQTEPFRRRI